MPVLDQAKFTRYSWSFFFKRYWLEIDLKETTPPLSTVCAFHTSPAKKKKKVGTQDHRSARTLTELALAQNRIASPNHE